MDWVDGAIPAALALLAAAVVALVARNLLGRAGALAGDRVDPVLATRFFIVRRLVVAAILLVGVFAAISQVDALDQLATNLLASSAIVAAIVGFASRQALGNAIAGVQLAIAQPVRIGDAITVAGESGVVEDVKLSATYIRTPADARIIVPNEQMIGSVVRNDTIVSMQIGTEVVVWLPAHADAGRAAEELRAEIADTGATVRIAEMSPEGAVKLVVTGAPAPPAQRIAEEGRLRATCLARLRGAGLLTAAG